MTLKFRKKPVVIEAYRFSNKIGHSRPDWLMKAVEEGSVRVVYPARSNVPSLSIDTLEGTMIATLGDWIIRGVAGEIYPCKPDIFERTYEAVIDE